MVGNRAFSSQNLGHVIVLYLSQRFFVILVASAHQIVKVINQRENLSVHLHKLDQSHAFTSKLLLEVHIENLCKSCQYNIYLSLLKNFETLLIFKLEVSLISQEHAWKSYKVHQHGYHKHDWVDEDCEHQSEKVLALVSFSLVVEHNIDGIHD